MSYESAKFGSAVHFLVGDGTLEKRLNYAAVAIMTLGERHFSDPDLLAKFRDLRRRLTAKGSWPDSIAAMSDAERRETAELFLSIDRHAA